MFCGPCNCWLVEMGWVVKVHVINVTVDIDAVDMLMDDTAA